MAEINLARNSNKNLNFFKAFINLKTRIRKLAQLKLMGI